MDRLYENGPLDIDVKGSPLFLHWSKIPWLKEWFVVILCLFVVILYPFCGHFASISGYFLVIMWSFCVSVVILHLCVVALRLFVAVLHPLQMFCVSL